VKSSVITCRPLQIERQQAFQDLFVAQIVRLAVGIEHGLVELAMGQIEPGRPLVVEVGQRALLELLLQGTFGVEPPVALFGQFTGALGDGYSSSIPSFSLSSASVSCQLIPLGL
jgi:hypothetical protein